jgi:hypothetical protein
MRGKVAGRGAGRSGPTMAHSGINSGTYCTRHIMCSNVEKVGTLGRSEPCDRFAGLDCPTIFLICLQV